MARFRVFLVASAAMLVGVLFATGLAAASMRSMLHVPRTVRPDVLGSEVVQMRAADQALLKASWLAPTPGSDRCVLFLHGSGGWRQRGAQFTPLLREEKYGLLAPDSRAHGESGGDKVTFGILEKYDALGWVKWMQAHGCQKIYGLGESLGSSVLILTAEIEPVFTAIVADCPFADLFEAAEVRIIRRLPLPDKVAGAFAAMAVEGDSLFARVFYGLDFSAVKPVESIKHVNTPILLIHGTADSRTPFTDSQALAAAKPDTTELWLVPGAEHLRSFATDPQEYSRKVVAWVQEH